MYFNDYVDVADANINLEEDNLDDAMEEEPTKSKGKGKDVIWEYSAEYKSSNEFNMSEFKKEIIETFTRRKSWQTEEAKNYNFCCKYQNKKGFKSCLRQLKICYLSTCHTVVVFSNLESHCHEEDLNYVTKKNYHWTSSQEKVIADHIKYPGKNNNQIILRQFKDEGLTNGSGFYPTLAQLGTKKRNMKKKNYKTN